MESVSPIAFYVFAILAIASALMVVLKRNPIASAFSLVLTFFCFAGIYVLLQAHLIAALQILVYAGAIMVLVVFVIMLLNADVPSLGTQKSNGWIRVIGVVLGSGLLALFVWAFKNASFTAKPGPFTPSAIEEIGGNTRVISQLMFSEYILPFELTSVLLLAVIVGSVAIAMRKKSKVPSYKKGARA